MTKKVTTLKMLILHESSDAAEQLMNAIRNAGIATRGQMVEGLQDFQDALSDGLWDLLLLRPEVNDLMAFDCLELVKQKAKDIPALLLIDDYDAELITQGLRAGFDDVVKVDDFDRIQLVIQREIRNLGERRDRRAAELKLRESEKRCTALLNNSRDAITYVIDGMLTFTNDAFIELFGYEDAEDLEGMPIMDVVAPQYHEAFKQFLRAYSAGEGVDAEFLCEGLRYGGDVVQTRMIFSSASYDGEPCTQILIRANGADSEMQKRIEEISHQDLLTGLYNRNFFNQALDAHIGWAVSQSKTVVLLYIELDNFSAVQSDIGIAGADMVLSDVASLLQSKVPESAELFRFGDDVFTSLIKDNSLDEGRAIGVALCQALENHLFEVQERTVQVTASIGVTLISENNDKAQDIIDSAHHACERVREESPLGNGVAVFVADLGDEPLQGVDGSALVQQAIDDGRFKLLFQPVIDLRGGSGELYEGFLRMLDDEGNEVEVSPKVFLGAISETELSEKVDRWVILQSIKLLSEHRAEGNNTRLIINITGESVKDQTILPWLSVALKAARMPSDAIVFQMSEADATTYLKQAKEFTRGLRELHCKVSLSSFGCALNPFNNLKHLEVDYIKFDGSFMGDLEAESSKETLKDMVTMAHAQGKLTIAPLVESAQVLSSLWQIGVNFIQGYYLQAPTETMNYDFSSDE